MSTILAVDTSATPVSCAILRDDRLIASYYAHIKSTHSQTLMPMIDHVLNISGLTMADVDAIAVNSGPGSFTGVRIGVSAVKGLAFATEDKRCVSVSTLESMAEAFRGLPMNAVLCCAMDARCNQVYSALFKISADGALVRLSEDEAVTLDELKNRLELLDAPIVFVGDGAEICLNYFKNVFSNIFIAPISVRYQSAENVAAVAKRMLDADLSITSDELLPSYLRLPQAERELRSRMEHA